jgi:uncharacterized protein with PhoU and TrkA domain
MGYCHRYTAARRGKQSIYKPQRPVKLRLGRVLRKKKRFHAKQYKEAESTQKKQANTLPLQFLLLVFARKGFIHHFSVI